MRMPLQLFVTKPSHCFCMTQQPHFSHYEANSTQLRMQGSGLKARVSEKRATRVCFRVGSKVTVEDKKKLEYKKQGGWRKKEREKQGLQKGRPIV